MTYKINSDRLCVNRKIAPNLSLSQFFTLVKELGLNKVEIRNDMKSGSVTDGFSGAEIRELANQQTFTIETINAVYPFNQLTDAVLEKTRGLLKDARETGAKALVLCPLNDGTLISNDQTVAALQTLAPLFAEYGIEGLVEPLGFPQSSLRSAALAQQLIKQAGVPFKIVLDTFHHHLYEGAEQDFAGGVDVKNIGLVHLSGVTDARPTAELTDEERIMLSAEDLLKSKQQVQRLEEMGYTGIYAFEPFSSVMDAWSKEDIAREIRTSIDYLNH
ncbi:inosose isomerase [Pantoea rodasii]|uniref:Inosose isomerase n=1 Tax=Pantoea rodasii TaxID=1076549 RepID=A0A2M9W609_9GAMM|nr:TIM barrel protein [Pantoea rodasii]ORM65325.1 inosose isomerase [Pantoea rodasii]PJZ02965.1 inosose isomerase [Pantoea rodasii]